MFVLELNTCVEHQGAWHTLTHLFDHRLKSSMITAYSIFELLVMALLLFIVLLTALPGREHIPRAE